VRDIVSARKGIDPDAVEENLVRAWLFLLAARTMPQEDFERLFEPGYFDHIMIPCCASSIEPLIGRIPSGFEEVSAFFRGVEVADIAHGLPEGLNGPSSCSTKVGLRRPSRAD
jgi:hypothetical protein